MKKIVRMILYTIGSLVAAVIVFGLLLAFLPMNSKVSHIGISPEEAAVKRQHFTEAHHQFTTTDGETLFLRRWDPDSIETGQKGPAILIFHGITAHSGAYAMAGKTLSAGGYTTFGLDYRGHGLSGGNRADYAGKERWVADLAEAIRYIEGLGFQKVVILGHSFGVAAAIYAVQAIPNEVSGLILLSGAYEGREGVRTPPSFFQKVKILASAVFRPSKQVVEYYRENMTGLDDPLFNFRYTLRFLRMLNIKELVIPKALNIPVLVAVGDRDELFAIDKVEELYNDVPVDQKEFLVLKDTYHARFPVESWERLVVWLDHNF